MQKKHGDEPAQGVTAEEVTALMREIHPVFAAKISLPLYVLDHERAHDAADWEALGELSPPLKRAPQPAIAPDFNKVVEHYHNSVKSRLAAWLTDHDLGFRVF